MENSITILRPKIEMIKHKINKNCKKSPWYVWIIGIVFIVILVNVLIQNNSPQETVKGFLKLLNQEI